MAVPSGRLAGDTGAACSSREAGFAAQMTALAEGGWDPVVRSGGCSLGRFGDRTLESL